MPGFDAEEVTDDRGDNRPIVYRDPDGRYVYRASALSSCPNALLAARLEYDREPPPDWLLQRFNAGHDHEPLILREMERRWGFKPYAPQQELELEVGGALVRGHVDSLVDTTNVPVGKTELHLGDREMLGPQLEGIAVVDAKAFSKSTYDQWERNGILAYPHYLWQQAMYCYSADFVGAFVAVKNKNTDDHRLEFYSLGWFRQHLPKVKIFKKVLGVEAAATQFGPEALFMEPCPKPLDFPCPYFKLHPREAKEPTTNATAAATDELATLITQWQELKASRETLDTEITRVGKLISAWFGDKKGSAKYDDTTVSAYFGSSSSPDWGGVAAALNMTEAEARGKFTVKKPHSTMSIRVVTKDPE